MNPLHHWHTMLNMTKFDETWHKEDMADELAEYHEARGFLDTWSELSDVVYTYTRAKWSGHTSIHFPLSTLQFLLGVVYMLPKYTLRWLFFRKLGHQFDRDLDLNVVRNPHKTAKLHLIAENHGLDPITFEAKAKELLKHSFLIR